MKRAGVSIALVTLLLHFASRTDVLSAVARPLVVGLCNACGVASLDRGDQLVIGALQVPWTRDCGGLNLLAVLLALTVWLRRDERSGMRFGGALLAALMLAIGANLARVGLIIGYRAAFYPAVEGPSLHYFLGFLCLLPCIWLMVPPGSGLRRLEIFYYAVVLAALSPHAGGPGGVVAALSTLALLSASRLQTIRPRALALWSGAGIAVAATSMESLWIPWLVVCPAFVPVRFWKGVEGAVLVLGTMPLVAMHALFVAVAAPVAWLWMRAPRTWVSNSPSVPRPLALALVAVLLMPFAAPALAALTTRVSPPPSVLMAQRLDATSWRVRALGQSAEVDVIWYAARGDGRHHSLPVCLAFRGITVEPVGQGPVMSDGRNWFREYFVVQGRVLDSYAAYLRRTALPFVPPGVHLVLTAPREAMDAEAFGRAAAATMDDMGPAVR